MIETQCITSRQGKAGRRLDGPPCMCDKRPLSPFDLVTINKWRQDGDTLESIAAVTRRDLRHLRRQLAMWMLKDPQLLHAAALVKERQRKRPNTRPRKGEK